MSGAVLAEAASCPPSNGRVLTSIRCRVTEGAEGAGEGQGRLLGPEEALLPAVTRAAPPVRPTGRPRRVASRTMEAGRPAPRRHLSVCLSVRLVGRATADRLALATVSVSVRSGLAL